MLRTFTTFKLAIDEKPIDVSIALIPSPKECHPFMLLISFMYNDEPLFMGTCVDDIEEFNKVITDFEDDLPRFESEIVKPLIQQINEVIDSKEIESTESSYDKDGKEIIFH